MRKTFNLLFICLIALYGWIGYQVIHTTDLPQCQPEGSLSDVAEEVIAIPLKTNGHCSLNKIKMIKRDREDIFLVSDRQLYHFNSSGQFLGQITAHLPGTRQPVELVDYAVDPVHDRLVVIGTGHEVYYYDYDGQLLFQSILPQDASWKTFGHMAYYNNHLWTTIDLVNSENKQAPSIEQWLNKFDLYFNEVGKRKLDVADLGRMDINYKTGTEIAVKDGHVYVQAPSLQPAHILNDTLYLINSNQLTITEDYAKILPLQIGTRFLISTHYDPTLPERSYTFCYDQRRTKAYHVQGGLDDNFYKTGKILELQSIDLQSNTYCYYKSGKELAYSFPDLTNKDNPVLFIVKMKARLPTARLSFNIYIYVRLENPSTQTYLHNRINSELIHDFRKRIVRIDFIQQIVDITIVRINIRFAVELDSQLEHYTKPFLRYGTAEPQTHIRTEIRNIQAT